MPARSEINDFGAGPAPLATDVLEDAAKALLNVNDTGLGVAEISHRSQLATDILNEAKARLATALDIPNDYEILFMPSGGTGQFSASVYNFVGAWVLRKQNELFGATDGELTEMESVQKLREAVQKELKLDYLMTGGWSQKAAAEAERLLGKDYVNVATDGRKENDGKFKSIPDESNWNLSKEAAFVYYCDNETVDGVEFPGFPKSLEPDAEGKAPIVIADMSSNILTRKIPIEKYSAIFFGAQKNLGIAGVTGVVIKKSFLPQPSPELLRKLALPIPPIMFQYNTIAKNNSLYNTLSIFDVYIIRQVLEKLLKTYPNKVAGQEEVTVKKSKLIYDAIESAPDAYKVIPNKATRSRINICFRVTKGGDVDAAEKTFLKETAAQGLTGLKGHRSLGGIRASNYNSVTVEGAEKLAKFIRDFATS